MNIEQQSINTIRILAIDMVEKAKSGHPGAPMGMAAIAYSLWQKHLCFNPRDPSWVNRDRFVLSAGHASALLYSLLYLYGYPLPVTQLENFRKLGSKTPGHPEYDIASGIETTTGPLGQGFANAAGMAVAENWMACTYNRPGMEIFNHYTYVLASDGDMMEGVSAEAASLAGTLRLGKLICLYDDNKITIEGPTETVFTEDVAQRFRSYGWQVLGPVDGTNVDDMDSALHQAKNETGRPSLIICRTCIGYGSPNKAGKACAHGEPLGEEEAKLTRQKLGWVQPEPFDVAPEVMKHFEAAGKRGAMEQEKWQDDYRNYSLNYPDLARQIELSLSGGLPEGWDADLARLSFSSEKPAATREYSGTILNAVAPKIPWLTGGAADLAPSTKTVIKSSGDFGPGSYCERNIHFGVREHAMGSIANGMSLYGGQIPYVSTFLIFYDYMRPPVRLAAMMGLRVIFVFTHDSIGLGEDGPTHQPVGQLMGLRLVPNLVTIRPADGPETVQAWKTALERTNGPTALVLTRQKVSIIERPDTEGAKPISKGGYVVWEASGSFEIILIATGSEVSIAVSAAKALFEKGVNTRVVSMLSWEIFDSQDEEYRQAVLPPGIKARISIEAGTTIGWRRYVGDYGRSIGVDRFGLSAPWQDVYSYFGLTADRVASEALKMLGRA